MAKPVTEIRVMELDMAKLDTDRPDTEIRVMEPDMDKLDTEITVMISQFFSEISVWNFFFSFAGYKQTAYASGYYDSYGYTQRYPEYSSYNKYTFYPYSGYHYKGKYGSSYQPLTHLNDYDPGVKNYREYLRYKDYYGKSKYHRPTIHIN